MWSPWPKSAAVFVSAKRLLLDVDGEALELIDTSQPLDELPPLFDRLKGHKAELLLGADLVRFTALPRIANLRTADERAKAAAALVQLPLSEWHLTVVDPSATSAWLVYAVRRQLHERLSELRSKCNGQIRYVKPYSGVLLESLTADSAFEGMAVVFERDADYVSWLVVSPGNVRAAGQVAGVSDELMQSEVTRLSLANGVAQASIRTASFDALTAVPTDASKAKRNALAFEQMITFA